MLIQIFLKTIRGDTLTLDVDEAATGAELLRIVKEEMRQSLQKKYCFKNSPTMEIYLDSIGYLFAGKRIPPDSSKPIGRSGHGIEIESTIHQVLRLAFSNPISYAMKLLDYEKVLDSIEQGEEKTDGTELSKIFEIKKYLELLRAQFHKENQDLFSAFQKSFYALSQRLVRFKTRLPVPATITNEIETLRANLDNEIKSINKSCFSFFLSYKAATKKKKYDCLTRLLEAEDLTKLKKMASDAKTDDRVMSGVISSRVKNLINDVSSDSPASIILRKLA